MQMQTLSFSLQIDQEIIAVSQVKHTDTQKQENQPTVLFLHGAGSAHQWRTAYLVERLSKHDIGSVSFDFSWQWASSGAMNDSSLKRRVKQTLWVLSQLDPLGPITVCASSMGAHVALKLLDYIAVENIVLFVPGIYDRAAYDVWFGDWFSEIIRQAESWRNSDVYELLAEFRGNFLVVTAEYDDVIPEWVITLLSDHAQQVRSKTFVTLPDAPHQIHNWIAAQETVADNIAAMMQALILDQKDR